MMRMTPFHGPRRTHLGAIALLVVLGLGTLSALPSSSAPLSAARLSPGGTSTTLMAGSGSHRSAEYPVTFLQSGLPSGTLWSVTLGGGTSSTRGTTLTFNEPNGTYAYTVGVIAGYHTSSAGNASVQGDPVNMTLKFSATTYTVKFLEKGLDNGTRWCVTFNAVKACLTSTMIAFSGIANGTYRFVLGHTSNYSLTGSYQGGLTVSGGAPFTVVAVLHVSWTHVVSSVPMDDGPLIEQYVLGLAAGNGSGGAPIVGTTDPPRTK